MKIPKAEGSIFEVVRQVLKAVVRSKVLQPNTSFGRMKHRKGKELEATDLSWLWSIEPSDLDEEDVSEEDDDRSGSNIFDDILPQRCDRIVENDHCHTFDKDIERFSAALDWLKRTSWT